MTKRERERGREEDEGMNATERETVEFVHRFLLRLLQFFLALSVRLGGRLTQLFHLGL